MRVFVTGASGFIGKAVVRELINAGHQVLGLSRSKDSAQILQNLGAEVQEGNLKNLDSLRSGAKACDAVIHLAFIHDFTDYANACRVDNEAIEAIGTALEGTNRPLIVTSGTLINMQASPGSEELIEGFRASSWARARSEDIALSFNSRGVRVTVLRLTPTNHGDGDKGFIHMMIAKAKEIGTSMYVGAGEHVWPATHYLDTAKAYRLALEKADAGGKVVNVVAEEGVPLKRIAEAIAEKQGIPSSSITPGEAVARFGFIAFPLMANAPCSVTETQEYLGWQPEQVTLLEDIKHGKYFQ